jgi:hypothetical protein|tara:strand:+ start:2636 stop:3409 length:774 start_codon:yes stop_codon:yes gene_type:complete
MKKNKFLLILDRKAQVGITLTWITAFLVIFFIMLIFIVVSSGLFAKKIIPRYLVFGGSDKNIIKLDDEKSIGSLNNQRKLIMLLNTPIKFEKNLNCLPLCENERWTFSSKYDDFCIDNNKCYCERDSFESCQSNQNKPFINQCETQTFNVNSKMDICFKTKDFEQIFPEKFEDNYITMDELIKLSDKDENYKFIVSKYVREILDLTSNNCWNVLIVYPDKDPLKINKNNEGCSGEFYELVVPSQDQKSIKINLKFKE